MQPRELTPQEIAEGQRGIMDDHLSAVQIQAMVRNMDHSKKKWKHIKRRAPREYEEKVMRENEKLYFNYPSLFQMHIEDRLNSTFFDMLQLKRKIEKGDMTVDQANQLMGQKLYSQFVPHVLNGATPPAAVMSYSDYYKEDA